MEQTKTHRVLWISRHTMTEEQRADLERVMGGPVELTVWSDTVENLQDLQPLVRRSDAVAAVLPAEKLAQLTPEASEAYWRIVRSYADQAIRHLESW